MKHLDYVRPELSKLNESWVGVADLPAHLEHLRTLIKEKTGRKMQAKATPIREGVIVIQQDTTITQLRGLANAIEQRWGIKTLQIYTHKDEGHTNSEGSWKPNLHAHIVFDWIDHTTGKSIKLSKQDMAEMQTMVADCLQMVRGESSDLQHLNAIQYKTMQEETRLQTLKDKTMKEEQERAQARAEAKQATIDTAEKIIARNQRPIIGPKWKDVAEQVIEDYERISAQKIEQDKLMKELGLDDDAFNSFWSECKDWFRDWGERLKDLALWMWGSPRGVIVEDVRYTADRDKGRLLIDGQTIEQVRAPKIVVPTSDVQRQAQAVRERNAGQSRDTDRRREQEQAQERQQRRRPKL